MTDIDPECPTCGGRVHSGCVCPRRLPSREELEAAREERLTRAERDEWLFGQLQVGDQLVVRLRQQMAERVRGAR